MDPGEDFGELRSLLHEPDDESWMRITHVVEGIDPERFVHQLTPYLLHHLARWPVHIARPAPQRWARAMLDGQRAPWIAIADFTDLPALSPAQADALREHPDWLRLRGLKLRRDTFAPHALIELLQEHPPPQLERLTLYDARLPFDPLRAILDALPRQLTHLDLRGNELRADDLPALARHPRLQTLQKLGLSHNPLDRDGLELALLHMPLPQLRELELDHIELSSPHPITGQLEGALPSLQRLSLGHNPGILGRVRPLLDDPPPALIDLELNDCAISSLRLAALFDTPLGGQLQTLDLSRNPFYRPSLEPWLGALGDIPHLALQHLVMVGCELDAASATQLAEADALRQLRSLNLSVNKLGDQGAAALGLSANFGELRTLRLKYNEIGPDGVDAIAFGEAFPNLQNLHLGANLAGSRGASMLARATSLPKLQKLWLGRNNLGDQGAEALCNGELLGQLRLLHLIRNGIGDRGAAALASSPLLGRLLVLNLALNFIQQPGAEALANANSLPDFMRQHWRWRANDATAGI